jgi:primosomal protein N' (replication factor Y)
VWDTPDDANAPDPTRLRPIAAVFEGAAPLSAVWRDLARFASRYYQRALGEVALAALPPMLRTMSAAQWQRQLQKAQKPPHQAAAQSSAAPESGHLAPPLSPEQGDALAAILGVDPTRHSPPVLLFGTTGSGKTEVYLTAAEHTLAADPQAQVLVMVPEINLTPQLEGRFRARFESLYGAQAVVSQHSGLTPAQRLHHWLAAHLGKARIVLGTRMAIWSSLPRLRLIIVDEEHDPSYKSQEGARYSARDLAVYRARQEHQAQVPCRVVLGSATPSLESWHAANQGRYLRVAMPARIGGGHLPALRLVNMQREPKGAVLALALIEALADRASRGEQALVLLNRRGYAPALSCNACGWKSHCPHCSAYRVFHKIDRSLRCHHCGYTERVPRACPDCGNQDIHPIGKGTEQLEEQVAALLSHVTGANGQALRVARMDADTTRTKGSLEAQLDQMHNGEVDVLVGTQMVAKGHDFRRITLVAALNVDAALYSSDYRAPERLFALLMQAAGRAGRDAALSTHAEMWIQTWHPEHPLFAALAQHDFARFAERELADREAADMPPFAYHALLRAEARTPEAALAFLQTVRHEAQKLPLAQEGRVMIYPTVPAPVQRVANVERTQMLLESHSRPALQQLLAQMPPLLQATRPSTPGLLRWAIDVDPLGI